MGGSTQFFSFLFHSNSIIKVELTYRTVYPFQVYHSVAFSMFAGLSDATTTSVWSQNIFVPSKRNLLPSGLSLSFSP